ncbi:MAG: hypothetical protein ACI9G1_004579 [Pirellulaceae bacterium]|jgi:hypothetical protein
MSVRCDTELEIIPAWRQFQSQRNLGAYVVSRFGGSAIRFGDSVWRFGLAIRFGDSVWRLLFEFVEFLAKLFDLFL